MAAHTKTSENFIREQFGSRLQQLLVLLNCDYIDGMDAAAVADLVLTPGKDRFYMLQWLFSRYDSRLSSLLNPTQDDRTKKDSTLQRLLTAATSMCLCRSDNIELIKGETPLPRQMSFINKLLDLVCTREKQFSSNQPAASQMNMYMDAVVGQEGFHYMLEDRVDLLPPDIRTEVESKWARSGSRVPPLPKLEDLVKKSQDLSVELEKNNLTLTRLKEEVIVQEEGRHAEVLSLNQVLSHSLRDLDQMCQGFSQCYHASVAQWCHRLPPQLSDLGPAFHRVHIQLSKFIRLLEDLGELRRIKSELDRLLREKPADGQHSLDEAAREASGSLEACLTILEEALNRSSAGFTPRAPLVSL